MSAVPVAERLAAAVAAVSAEPVPSLRACLELARAHEAAGDAAVAVRWAFAATDAGEDLAGWTTAQRIVQRCRAALPAPARRARVAVLGSYTTAQLTALLPLAGLRAGAELEVRETGYGQYRTEVLDPSSALHAFAPEVVVLAVHEGEVALPERTDDPAAAVEAELARWTGLWRQLQERFGARVVQHTIAIPPEVALGHLAARTPGSRYAMLELLNVRLGEAAAAAGVGVVDCERLAGLAGKRAWFDARYLHLAKQAVGLGCVPLLARHTAAVVTGGLGLARKCLVLDLDGTLWGGVLGEVGPHGVAVGGGPVGEAYSAFQRYVLQLKDKGVVLAVCTKNDPADVQEVFEQNTDMLVRLDDLAVVEAGWADKPAALRRIAAGLGIGLDSLVFVDDNPAEREAVRQLTPEVDVVPLPPDPAGYVRALAEYPWFETAALTDDDAARTAQYRARAETAALQAEAGSLEGFLASLDMRATFGDLGPANVARVAQLIGKTNQFNLTTRRRGQAEVEALAADEAWTAQVVRLRDRFADHGVVGVLLARSDGDALDVDTWLLSCRVIGRTLEEEMLRELVARATALGCARITGTYVPSAKNSQVADLYARLGFTRTSGDEDGTTRWELRLPADLPAPGAIARERVADVRGTSAHGMGKVGGRAVDVVQEGVR
ncbi:HAD-IIIC family phosphatase [Kineococcus glutinatus]|uniref:HAD-IIIC family phosphatase n=1 Tax=Kineococcus glutinatus TaxID=1070872 RepID=A0ABP9HMC8_9ACTN